MHYIFVIEACNDVICAVFGAMFLTANPRPRKFDLIGVLKQVPWKHRVLKIGGLSTTQSGLV